MRLSELWLIDIPAARFCMGCNHGSDNQAPARFVHVGGFLMMAVPVSRRLYHVWLEENPGCAPPFWNEPRYAHPEQPAVGVSWHDAVAFADWASDACGVTLRLPTEAEREWAASGGVVDHVYPWGNQPRETPKGPLGDGPPLLGSTPPNAFGLFHMADGVHEWCLDGYARDAYRNASCDNPLGPSDGARRVARGGSWRHQVPVTPFRARSSLPPDHRYADFGFRLVLAGRGTGRDS